MCYTGVNELSELQIFYRSFATLLYHPAALMKQTLGDWKATQKRWNVAVNCLNHAALSRNNMMHSAVTTCMAIAEQGLSEVCNTGELEVVLASQVVTKVVKMH